jgi:hypothetical protein
MFKCDTLPYGYSLECSVVFKFAEPLDDFSVVCSISTRRLMVFQWYVQIRRAADRLFVGMFKFDCLAWNNG